jgi:hypothetical protein
MDHWQPSSWVHMLDKTLVGMKIERNCIQIHKRQQRTKSLKFSSIAKALVVSLNTWQAKHETSFWCIWDSQGRIFYPLSLSNQGATHMFQIVINGLHTLHPMERYMIARVENFLINHVKVLTSPCFWRVIQIKMLPISVSFFDNFLFKK